MIGSIIGTYRILDKIGEGGMGTVYRGVDVMLDREVAVKVLKPELLSNQQLVERFRTEAVLLGKLSHPNIAILYGFLPVGNQFAMVMEFLHGTPLDHLVEQGGAMRCEQAIPLFCGILDAIGHAHRNGIVHRDIKPSNIIVLPDGTPKVMDFGIARALGSSHQTRAGAIVGTLEYMSPEQIKGQETDGRSDIYSLGILLYEMLTGRVPFSSASEYELLQAHINTPPPTPRLFGPHIPEPLAQAVMRALAKDPNQRYQTAEDFHAALTTIPLAASMVSPTPNCGFGIFPAVSAMTAAANQAPPPVTRLAGVSSPGMPPPSPQFSQYQPAPVSQPEYQWPAPPAPERGKGVLKVAVGAVAALAFLLFIGAIVGFIWVNRSDPSQPTAPGSASQPAPKVEPKVEPKPAPQTPTPAPKKMEEPLEPTQPNFPTAEPDSGTTAPPPPPSPGGQSPNTPPAKPQPPNENGKDASKAGPTGKEKVAKAGPTRKPGSDNVAKAREKKRKEALKALDQ